MKKILLTIFDGFGEAPPGPGNAVTLAKTPHLNELRKKYPFGLLQASGEAVGLVAGSMGGSEVGHFTMGAGRVVPQFLLAINKDIASGAFFKKQPLIDVADYLKITPKKLHLLGMISDKGVHSHIDHLFALLEWAKREGITNVYVHAIADGRDVEERSVERYLKQLADKMAELGVGKLATLIGRYYTMDRDTNWARTEKGYRLMTLGEGEFFEDAMKGVHHYYDKAKDEVKDKATDQYLEPIVVDKAGLVETGDAIIYFNYRTDRTRQMTSAFTDPGFDHFKRTIGDVKFVCMGPYSDIAPVLYGVQEVKNNLGSWLSQHHVRQLRVAETEKYAHLTYFFNSQVEEPMPLEDRVHIHTPKIATHDEKPELASREITQAVTDAMDKGDHPVILVNYASMDLVGHTGLLPATIKAVEALDAAAGALYESAMKNGYTMLLTGDHGNAEDMLYPDGSPKPAHSNNPVIFLVADPEGKIDSVHNGGLADVAPTILKLLDIELPAEMTGHSLA